MMETQTIVAGLIIAIGVLAFVVTRLTHQVTRHHKALEWFADHVYANPKPHAEPPEELKTLIEKE